MSQASGQQEEQRSRPAMAGGWAGGRAPRILLIVVVGALALVGALGISRALVPLERERATGPEPVGPQLARGAPALLPAALAAGPARVARVAYVGYQGQRDTYTPNKGRLLDSFLAQPFDPAVVDAFVKVAPTLHLLSQEPEG